MQDIKISSPTELSVVHHERMIVTPQKNQNIAFMVILRNSQFFCALKTSKIDFLICDYRISSRTCLLSCLICSSIDFSRLFRDFTLSFGRILAGRIDKDPLTSTVRTEGDFCIL